MSASGLRLRAAAVEELPIVQEILADASRWEAARGLPHPWPVPFPAERLLPALGRGEVHIADLAGAANVATVTLQWTDEPHWGERPADAGYVHRLAVRRSFAGREIGTALLDWATAVARDHGRRYVRLDTLLAAPRLHAYYERHGFRLVGEVRVNDLDKVLFEKRIAP